MDKINRYSFQSYQQCKLKNLKLLLNKSDLNYNVNKLIN